MEALHYLGIVQVFLLFATSSILDCRSAQVIFGAMDDKKNFRMGETEYNQFRRMAASLDYIIARF